MHQKMYLRSRRLKDAINLELRFELNIVYGLGVFFSWCCKGCPLKSYVHGGQLKVSLALLSVIYITNNRV